MSVFFDVVLPPPPESINEMRKRSLVITVNAETEAIDLEGSAMVVAGFECEEGDVVMLSLTDYGWGWPELGKKSIPEITVPHAGTKDAMPPKQPAQAGRAG